MDTKQVNRIYVDRVYLYEGDDVKVVKTTTSAGVKLVEFKILNKGQRGVVLRKKFVRLAQEYVDQSAFKPKAESL